MQKNRKGKKEDRKEEIDRERTAYNIPIQNFIRADDTVQMSFCLDLNELTLLFFYCSLI